MSAGLQQPKETTSSRGLRHVFAGCRVIFYVVVPLSLLAMIAVGILYVRLRHGPIAFDFIVAPIERGINHELTSSSLKIDGAELRLGPNGELEFRLRDVSVLEIGGDVVLSSPLAAVNISMAALLRGRVERMHRSCLILTFGGGTNEIQRDIIGMVALGLPRVNR